MKIQIKTNKITLNRELMQKLDELSSKMLSLVCDNDNHSYIELTAEQFDQTNFSACMPIDRMCYEMAMSSVTFKTVQPVDKLKLVKKIYDEKISMLEADIKQLRHELQALT